MDSAEDARLAAPAASRGRGTGLLRVLGVVGLVALAGCSERPPSFHAAYSGDVGVSATAGQSAAGTFTFTVPRIGADAKGNRIYARPGRAILKLPGYLPVPPQAVEETADAFVVTFLVPEDARKAASLDGELLLPIDTGVISFTGIERHVASTAYLRVRLTPVYEGPLAGLAVNVGAFFRGLYAAR